MNSEPPSNFVCPPFDDGHFASRDLERGHTGTTWVKHGLRSILNHNGQIVGYEGDSAPSAPPRETSPNPQ